MTGSNEFAEVFRTDWPKVVATLVRDLGDLDLAEDAVQDAFEAAATHWPERGWPAVPRAWLITTARRKAIDRLRRLQRYQDRVGELERRAAAEPSDDLAGHGLVDDQLALILGCCHPALAPDGQVALTLRMVAGLTATQIARSFLVSESTMTRRITRAKRKIAGANITFRADRDRLPARLESVCAVIYSIYTEGHASASDVDLVRGDLCDEALWLAALVAELVPNDAEVHGLHALLLLSDARRPARMTPAGLLVLLPDQDRGRWDQTKIAQGQAALRRAHGAARLGPYQLQAAIAALHATAPDFAATPWQRIIDLYDVLLADGADAITALNRAAAVGHQQGPDAGLQAIDELPAAAHERLISYPYLHACRGEFLAQAGNSVSAVSSFEEALALTRNRAEQMHLTRRLAALSERSTGSSLAARRATGL